MSDPLASRARRAWRWLAAPEQPVAAIEVRPGSLGLVRLARDGRGPALSGAALVELPEGAVAISLVEPNVADAEAFRAALRTLVERAGLLGGARVALIVPDAAARAVLLELEGGGAGAPLEELVRFRLRKVVPFDVREARVAARRLSGARPGEPGVIAVSMAAGVIASYEEPLEELGLRLGHVELSGLALLRFAPGGADDRLLVNWDAGYATIALTRAGRPLLIRTLPGEAAASADAVAREVSQTLLYHRDRLGGEALAGAALRAPDDQAEELCDRLRDPLGLVPEILAPWAALGATAPLPGASNLAGAAACLLAREDAA